MNFDFLACLGVAIAVAPIGVVAAFSTLRNSCSVAGHVYNHKSCSQ